MQYDYEIKYHIMGEIDSKVIVLRAFTTVELKSYNIILALLIYQKHLAAVIILFILLLPSCRAPLKASEPISFFSSCSFQSL